MAILDPKNLLGAIEWTTREHVSALGIRFSRATGLDLRVRSGRRTCAEQDRIYQQGRESSGDVVTYASGCRSWHVLGRAVDMDPVDAAGGARPLADYQTAGALWKAMGGRWGGDFPGFPDIGHFEWHPGMTIEQACPSPSYCSQIEASIETSPTFTYYAVVGALLSGGAFWALRQFRPTLLPAAVR